jgi:hypothetical protein
MSRLSCETWDFVKRSSARSCLKKYESPGNQPRLGTDTGRRLRNMLSITLLAPMSSTLLSCRVTTEGEGLEPWWLIKPLERFADGGQYPLATPSKRCLRK